MQSSATIGKSSGFAGFGASRVGYLANSATSLIMIPSPGSGRVIRCGRRLPAPWTSLWGLITRKRRRQSRGLRNLSVGSHHPFSHPRLQFALRREWLLTLDFADETAGYLKPLLPPRKSRGSPADASAEPWPSRIKALESIGRGWHDQSVIVTPYIRQGLVCGRVQQVLYSIPRVGSG